jgi:hypothetical protein
MPNARRRKRRTRRRLRAPKALPQKKARLHLRSDDDNDNNNANANANATPLKLGYGDLRGYYYSVSGQLDALIRKQMPTHANCEIPAHVKDSACRDVLKTLNAIKSREAKVRWCWRGAFLSLFLITLCFSFKAKAEGKAPKPVVLHHRSLQRTTSFAIAKVGWGTKEEWAALNGKKNSAGLYALFNNRFKFILSAPLFSF